MCLVGKTQTIMINTQPINNIVNVDGKFLKMLEFYLLIS